MSATTEHPYQTKPNDTLETQLDRMFGVNRPQARATRTCVSAPIGCGQPAESFRDELSRKEFNISGLCQKCQDAIFGADIMDL